MYWKYAACAGFVAPFLAPPASARQKWSDFASVGIPVVKHLYGVQAEPHWRLLTGITVSF